jgi:hypothetical protein
MTVVSVVSKLCLLLSSPASVTEGSRLSTHLPLANRAVLIDPAHAFTSPNRPSRSLPATSARSDSRGAGEPLRTSLPSGRDPSVIPARPLLITSLLIVG